MRRVAVLFCPIDRFFLSVICREDVVGVILDDEISDRASLRSPFWPRFNVYRCHSSLPDPTLRVGCGNSTSRRVELEGGCGALSDPEVQRPLQMFLILRSRAKCAASDSSAPPLVRRGVITPMCSGLLVTTALAHSSLQGRPVERASVRRDDPARLTARQARHIADVAACEAWKHRMEGYGGLAQPC
jgi:hypothetical protein